MTLQFHHIDQIEYGIIYIQMYMWTVKTPASLLVLVKNVLVDHIFGLNMRCLANDVDMNKNIKQINVLIMQEVQRICKDP